MAKEIDEGKYICYYNAISLFKFSRMDRSSKTLSPTQQDRLTECSFGKRVRNTLPGVLALGATLLPQIGNAAPSTQFSNLSNQSISNITDPSHNHGGSVRLKEERQNTETHLEGLTPPYYQDKYNYQEAYKSKEEKPNLLGFYLLGLAVIAGASKNLKERAKGKDWSERELSTLAISLGLIGSVHTALYAPVVSPAISNLFSKTAPKIADAVCVTPEVTQVSMFIGLMLLGISVPNGVGAAISEVISSAKHPISSTKKDGTSEKH